jgi:hypothetical protein
LDKVKSNKKYPMLLKFWAEWSGLKRRLLIFRSICIMGMRCDGFFYLSFQNGCFIYVCFDINRSKSSLLLGFLIKLGLVGLILIYASPFGEAFFMCVSSCMGAI